MNSKYEPEISIFNQLAERLKSSLTMEDAYHDFIHHTESLFPKSSGALYLLNPATNRMEAVLNWGRLDGGWSFLPEECWVAVSQLVQEADEYARGKNALATGLKPGPREGQVVAAAGTELCPHLLYELSAADLPLTDSLCVPVLVKGELLGILQLQWANPGSEESQWAGMDPRQFLTVAEALGLILTNIKLHEG